MLRSRIVGSARVARAALRSRCSCLVACSCAAAVNTVKSFTTLAAVNKPSLRSSFFSINQLSSSSSSINVQARGFASGKYPDHILLTMPALSPTMEKGNIAKWLKQIGDEVMPGDAMADVETDKATVAFESVEQGYMAKILVGDGANDVVVGTPVAVLAENKEDVAKFKDFTGDGSASAAPAAESAAEPKAQVKKASDATESKSAPASSAASGGRVVASPAAKRIAGEKGLSLQGLKGTGPDGRILAADVNEAAESGSLTKQTSSASAQAPATAAPSKSVQPSSAGDFVDIPHTQIRKVIASRLLQSKTTIPHYYLTSECNVDALMKIRGELNLKSETSGVKLSVNDFIVKAAALACRKVPEANSSWTDNAIRQFNYVDMSIAVSTDSGLITPVIRDADIKGLHTISAETKSLAKRAREGKLKPEEFQGGTFTLSNLGMFGVSQFAAIINPPQAAILAIGTSESKVVEVAPGQFKTSSVMNVTLSCDHRVVDGAVGAQWLQAFKGFIENPITMIL